MDDRLWKIEERLWTGGADRYAESLDPACLMAFPPPVGMMRYEAILKSIREAPRWAEVEMADRTQTRPRDGVAVLAYRATARRPGEDATYAAICTSVYAGHGEDWRMVQHQQTPVSKAGS